MEPVTAGSLQVWRDRERLRDLVVDANDGMEEHGIEVDEPPPPPLVDAIASASRSCRAPWSWW